MKKIAITLFVFTLSLYAVAQQVAVNYKPAATITLDDAAFAWKTTTFDFGKIKKDKPVTHEFTFTNSGKAALVVTSVQASCGCTVAQYSKDPIEPGSDGFVKATYNAAKTGVFTKTVTVNANTPEGVVILTIKGEVTE
jgi:hypothetical protein